MRETLALALDLLLRPGRALDRLASEPESYSSALKVYLLCLAANVLFFAWKPADFPPLPAGAPFEAASGGLAFWTAVHAWDPLLTALWVAATGIFSVLLDGGWLPLRLSAATLLGLAPFGLILVYKNTALPRWGFGLTLLLLAAAMVPAGLRVARDRWRPLAAWLASAYLIGVVVMPARIATVLSRQAQAFTALDLVAVIWTLGLATYGIGRLFGLRAARAFSAAFLALLFQLCFIPALYLLGILPKSILKGMLTP